MRNLRIVAAVVKTPTQRGESATRPPSQWKDARQSQWKQASAITIERLQ
jgi:hypothetical protein